MDKTMTDKQLHGLTASLFAGGACFYELAEDAVPDLLSPSTCL